MTKRKMGWQEDHQCKVTVTVDGGSPQATGLHKTVAGEELFTKYLEMHHCIPTRVTLEVWGENSPILMKDYTSHENQYTDNLINW